MQRKARILRFWLWSISVLALSVWQPQFGVGFWPVLFFFSCNPCQATSPCTSCVGGTQGVTNIQVEFDGFANLSSSNCGNLNATFTLDYFPSGGATPCRYALLSPVVGCGGNELIRFSWSAIASLASFTNASVVFPGLGGGAIWDKNLGYPWDCQDGTGLYGADNPTSAFDACCDSSAATCVVTPLP